MSLAAAIKKATGVEARIEAGSVGQFDVLVDGRLIFSKHKEYRFPDDDEILRALNG
ncbi:MAG: Rdx family protein [Polyangiaceae bacterium]|nr:Rdx family protein [Polyangiaceae bacterium]